MFLCLSICLLSTGTLGAQQQLQVNNVRDQPLKAAYLYNFAKYTEIPADYARTIEGSDRFIVIGIVGDTEVERHLRTIAQRKTVNGKQLLVQTFADVDAIKPCHMLFVPGQVSNETMARINNAMQTHSAFVISESPAHLSSVQASFFLEDNKIKFSVNLTETESKKVQLSSNLLRFGKLVRTVTTAPSSDEKNGAGQQDQSPDQRPHSSESDRGKR